MATFRSQCEKVVIGDVAAAFAGRSASDEVEYGFVIR